MTEPDNGQFPKTGLNPNSGHFLTNRKGHYLEVRKINQNKLYKLLYEPNMKLS